MADNSPFAKFVPGFDFLQGLVSNAGAALPNIGQWVAPTLNPQELEKRIEELRTVQFWLEQNARMLGATIQALEVQRMTLSTLKTMNVQMEDLRDSLKIKTPEASAMGGFFNAPTPTPAPKAATTPPPVATPPATPQTSASTMAPPSEPTAAPPGVDPLQWWGALTQQFTQLATQALQQSATEASKHMAQSLKPKTQASASQSAPGAHHAKSTKGTKPTVKPGAKAPPRARPKSKD